MPNSYCQYRGDGSTIQYDISFPYLDQEDVHVMIDDAGRAFTWLSSTRIKLLGSAPPLNSLITISRQTGRNARKVVFENANLLDKESLNRANTQAFYLSQEAFEELSKQASGEYMYTPLQYDVQTLQNVLLGSVRLEQLAPNIYSASGDTPFTLVEGALAVNGNVIATGSVSAAALHTDEVYTVTLQSNNWPSSGYMLNANTNTFQLGGQWGGIANPGIYWDGTALSIKGTVTFLDPSSVRTQLNVADGATANQADTVTNSAINTAATTAAWSGVSGTGKPADNATVGATTTEAANIAKAVGWQSSSDTTKIDGGKIYAGSSITTGNTAVVNGNLYSVLTGGDIQFYDCYGGSFKQYKSLKKNYAGVCTDGQSVNVGYFRDTPTIIISPKSLDCYRTAYSSQDQKFVLDATNIRKSGDDWLFDAVCQLQLSANSIVGGTTVEASGSGNGPVVGWKGPFYTAQVNTGMVNVRTVNCTAKVKAVGWLYTNNDWTKSALEIYYNEAWHTGGFLESPHAADYFYLTHEMTAIADITAFRFVFYGYRLSSCYDCFSSYYYCSVSGSRYSLVSATISLAGTANYMAIG